MTAQRGAAGRESRGGGPCEVWVGEEVGESHSAGGTGGGERWRGPRRNWVGQSCS